MSTADTRARVAASLEGLAHAFSEPRDGMTCVEVGVGELRAVLERLKQRAGFDGNTFVTGVDLYPAEPRFEVVYQFMSFANAERVRVRVRVPSSDARVLTCSDLWPGASFSERECFDLFGIRFDGHPDLRRLMMPDEYEHHPLRKDFPHRGIEPDKLYRAWDRERRKSWNPAP